MVAIVSGNSLGLSLSTLATLGQRGAFGSASQGAGAEQAFVNIATGNLVLQRSDEQLIAPGLSLGSVRTYNSAGELNDDNADNWSLGIYNQPLVLSGTLNTAGSTLTRTASDGAQALYTFDVGSQLYITTDGAGAHDTIAWDSAASQYLWTDGTSGTQERYEGNANAKLLSRTDANGNSCTYHYTGSLLTSVSSSNNNGANNEVTYYDYSGNNLSAIRTVAQDGSTSTRVRYAYDGSNRLTTVTVDLTPADNSIVDGKTYVTSYTYDDSAGTSRRIASVSQSDGSRLDITYTLVGDSYRVASVKDALNQTTTYSYDTTAGQTTVTDPLNVASRYSYDAQGQLTQVQTGITAAKPQGLTQLYYTYDAQGNVKAVTDALGASISFQYDDHGNQT
jgi:YD repeat-containing protein